VDKKILDKTEGKHIDHFGHEAGLQKSIGILDLDDKILLTNRDGIRDFLRDNSESTGISMDFIIDDIIADLGCIISQPWWLVTVTFGLIFVKVYRKKNKLKKVIESLLNKLFDPTQDYALDYEDLKETCRYNAREGYFDLKDHRHIYRIIIQKFKEGPIREMCIRISKVDYIDLKISLIQENLNYFKLKEL